MIRLADISSSPPADADKKALKDERDELLDELYDLHRMMYAQEKHSLLVVLQGMDASGKDGTTRDVFGSCHPHGLRVNSFKVPTDEELAHDFLWRVHHHTPKKGYIQVFNRSHYEDVLVTRLLGLCDDVTALERFELINAFERILAHNGTVVLKFYLHISKDQQAIELQERMTDPTKHWKHNPKDWETRERWDEFMRSYEDVFAHCSQPFPWHIIPADENWYKEYRVARTVVETLRSFEMSYPPLED